MVPKQSTILKLSYYLASARPKQWLKNLLVLVAPISAGNLLAPGNLLLEIICFLGMSLIASSIYFINDVIDINQDRDHPVKKFRPIAFGKIPTSAAISVSIALALLGLVFLQWINNLSITVGIIYLVIQLIYVLYLKRIAVFELFFVSSGFLLRVVLGAVAVDLSVSSWLLSVVGSAAMLIVVGKRLSELVATSQSSEAEHSVRKVLSVYTRDSLFAMEILAATACVSSYIFWALEANKDAGLVTELSAITFTMTIFSYLQKSLTTGAEKPEDDLFAKPIAFSALITIVLVMTGVGING